MRVARAAFIGGLMGSAAAMDCYGVWSYPAAITAGDSFELTLAPNWTDCDLSQDIAPNRPAFDTYRVYLAINTDGYYQQLACLLMNDTLVSQSNSSLIIPSDLGPNADSYAIAITAFYNDPTGNATRYGHTGYGPFTLVGSKVSSWSEYVNKGLRLWEANNLPCTAFNCAAQCASHHFPLDNKGQQNIMQMSDCILKCPGVTPQSQYLGWNGDGCAPGDEFCCDEYNDCWDPADIALITTSLATTIPPPTGTPTNHNQAARMTGGIAAILGAAGAIAAFM